MRETVVPYVAAIIAIVVCVYVLRARLTGRWFGHRPNLRLEHLVTIFDDKRTFLINNDPIRKKPHMDRSVEAVCGTISILYHCKRRPGRFLEEVDVFYPGMMGMNFTLENEQVGRVEYIGDSITTNPELSEDEHLSLKLFMSELRILLCKP